MARRQRTIANTVTTGNHQRISAEQWDIAELDAMPTLEEICLAPIQTRDFIGDGLFPKAEQQFNRCIANVLLHNRTDDYDLVGREGDTVFHKRSRMVWLELWMFCKVCLSVLPGGRSKQNRNNNILLSRLERWASGERRALWDEACSKIRKRKGGKGKSNEDEASRRQAIAIELSRRGMPSKAMQRLIGPGLAKESKEIDKIMRAKFVEPPSHQQGSSRVVPPEANMISEQAVVDAVKSFPRGAGAGPTGMRPDFVKQIVGEGTEEKPGTALLTSLVNLLADGKASSHLRTYIGEQWAKRGRKRARQERRMHVHFAPVRRCVDSLVNACWELSSKPCVTICSLIN